MKDQAWYRALLFSPVRTSPSYLDFCMLKESDRGQNSQGRDGNEEMQRQIRQEHILASARRCIVSAMDRLHGRVRNDELYIIHFQ